MGLLGSSDGVSIWDAATNVSDTNSLQTYICSPHPGYRFGYGAVSLPMP